MTLDEYGRAVRAPLFLLLLMLLHAGLVSAHAQGKAKTGSRRGQERSAAQVDGRAREYMEAGLRHAEAGKWDEALKAYKLALSLSPDFAEALVNMGDAHMSLGDYEGAFSAYREAIRVAPRYAEAHHSLGAAYNEMAQYGDAFKPFVRAIQLDPSHAGAHYGIGYAYLKLENFREAFPYLRQAIRLMPDFAEAHLALGQAHLAVGDLKGAEAQRKALEGLDRPLAQELESEIRKAGGLAPQPAQEARSGGSAPAQSRPAAPDRAKTDPASMLAVELSFWDSIKESRDPEEFAAYLKKYPEGQFAELARIRMRALEGRRAATAKQAGEPRQEISDSRPEPQSESPAASAQTQASPPPEQPTPALREPPPRPEAPQPKEQPQEEQPQIEQPQKEQPQATRAEGGEAQTSVARNANEAQPVRAAVETTREATLEETMSFMRREFPTSFAYKSTTRGQEPGALPATNDVQVSYEPLRFDGCSIEWRDSRDTLSVSLADLDPESVRVEPRVTPGATFSTEVWNLSITAKGERGSIREAKGDGSGAVNHYSGLELQFDNRDKAERLSRALRHAIELCGGKRE